MRSMFSLAIPPFPCFAYELPMRFLSLSNYASTFPQDLVARQMALIRSWKVSWESLGKINILWTLSIFLLCIAYYLPIISLLKRPYGRCRRLVGCALGLWLRSETLTLLEWFWCTDRKTMGKPSRKRNCAPQRGLDAFCYQTHFVCICLCYLLANLYLLKSPSKQI